MLWMWIGAALALEIGQTEVTVSSVTPEMHWFDARFLDVEQAGCDVGVPTSGEGDVVLACFYPAGRGEEDVPSELRKAARRARKAVRATSEEHMSRLRLAYVGTGRRAAGWSDRPSPRGPGRSRSGSG